MHKREARRILSTFLAICMLMTGISFQSMQVQAENEATVVDVYAVFPEEGEPGDFEVAEVGTQPEGKGIYCRIIRNGTYAVSDEDAEYGLPLIIDNATVTYPQGYEVNPFDIKLSGQSSLQMDTHTVSSDSEVYGAPVITNDNIGDFLQFYEDHPPYSYTFTKDATWTGWSGMDTLTVNSGVTLTISHGNDGENDYSSVIEAKNAVINGTVVIEGNEIEQSNRLAIEGEGSLTVNGGSLTGSGNANLEIRENVTISGISLYDSWDEESSQWKEYTGDENQQDCTNFSFDTEAGKWVRIQDSGEPGPLPDNRFRIIRIGDGDLGLSVDGIPSGFDEGDTDRAFENGATINFTITGEVYKVVVVPGEPEIVIPGTEGNYSYTPDSDSGFEILVYTSQEAYDYDRCQPNPDEGEFSVEYQIRYRDEEAAGAENRVTPDTVQLGSNLVAQATNGEMNKLILRDGTSNVVLTISLAEGYKYNVTMHDEQDVDVTEEVQSNNNQLIWDVTAKEHAARPEICFERDNGGSNPDPDDPDPNPNPNPGDDRGLKSYIEEMQFAFGDWDEDGGVDEEDIKLGMAYQIFYPRLDQNRNLQEEYQIPNYNSLIDLITVTEDSAQNLTAKDADGVDRTIPAYSYTVRLSKGTGEAEEQIEAVGVAYAFQFTDGSKYQENNRGCVIAVTEKGGVKNYFLRCVNAYKDGTTSDITPMVAGENLGEASIVVVSDFDVIQNPQDSTYDRKVSVFGNGAGLDALFSQEEDTDIVAYLGRNEDFMNAIGKSQEWGTIFSVFTFCQESFSGVQVKGTGASGNTPSWAFNQYPVFSTDNSENTEKEAVVYFGNPDVTIKPVNNLTGLEDAIEGIALVELADSNTPTTAVEITQQSATEWKVTFHSDFYDQVKVKIVYSLQGGGTKTSYLNIHRVGIDILSGDGSNGMTLFHGTENGPTYDAAGERVIWGTYYYPQAVSGTGLVDLYVTYTWPDGSITKETIHNDPSLNMEFHHDGTNDCQSSDFILYDGSRAGEPVKIEANRSL